MSRKITLITLMVLGLLLSACGPAAKPTPVPEATAVPRETPTEPPAAEPVTVVYWSFWNEGEPATPVVKQWIAGYEKEHPNVKFDLTFAGREVLTKLQTALSAGTKVDLIEHEGPPMRGSLIKNGLALSMEPLLRQKAYDADVNWEDTFMPGSLDLLKGADGQRYFIPYDPLTTGFFYDQRVFDRCGITEMPETWDEFLSLCEELKGCGIAPLTQDGGLSMYNGWWLVHLSEKLLGPGGLLAACEDPTGTKWDDPAFLKAAQMARSVWEKGYIIEGAEGFIWPAGQIELAVGNAAMELLGSWLPNEVRDSTDPDFVWRFFPFPEIEGGKGKRTDMELFPMGFVVLKDGSHADVAADFVRFVTSKENQTLFVEETMNLSLHRDAPAPKELEDPSKWFKNATTIWQFYDGVVNEYPDYYATVLLPWWDKVFLGEITPEEFIESIKEATIEYWETH